MKRINQILLTLAALFGMTAAGFATTILNQTNWPDAPAGSAMILKTNQNFPITASWQSGTAANYEGTNGTLQCFVPIGSLSVWSYFADSNSPVQVGPGELLRVTAIITFSNVVAQNANRGLRWGLMWAGTNMPFHTNPGTIRNDHLTGYGQNMNVGTSFGVAPLATFANTNSVDGQGIISKAVELIDLGANGGGTTNDPGFTDGVPYKFIMSVAPTAPNSVDVTTTVIGSTFNNGFITQTITDATWAYTNFDMFVIRPNSSSTVANQFGFSGFKAEKLPVTPSAPQLTSVKKQGSSTILTWNCDPGYTYSVLRTTNLQNSIATWSAITANYPLGFTPGSSISYTDTTASATANFYLIRSP